MAKKKKAAKKKAPTRKQRESHYTIHLISASTGDLLYRLASVASTQFSDIEFDLVPHALVDDNEKLELVLRAISGPNAIVVHALADPAAKRLVRSRCVLQRIPHYDATGPLLDFLADCVGRLADNDLSRLHRVDEAYEERIAAMEFAIEHDDGLGLATLQEADIVIVGVSRVSKSPTTLFLGSRGFKVANVSISPQTGFPPELSKISKKKIVALSMKPKRLFEIRAERMKSVGASGTDYDKLSSVIHEVMESEAEYKRRGYPIVDVTSLTIEQTAAEILAALGLRLGS